MIRVAIISTSFPDPSHNYIWAWLQKMLYEGIEINILTENINRNTLNNPYFKDPALWERIISINRVDSLEKLLKSSINLYYLRNVNVLYKLFLVYHTYGYGLKKKIYRTFEYLPWISKNYDIVHYNYPRIAVRRLEIGKVIGRKTLVSFRGQDLTFYPGFFNSLFKEIDHIHFISRHLIDEAVKQGYSGGKHSLIPPMVDTGFYEPPYIEKKHKNKNNEFVILTCARFYWTKGWEYALKAIQILITKGWKIRYLIAGDGDLRDAIIYTIHQLGLQDHVELLGWLDPYMYKDIMQASDLYLLTSVEEAFNNSVLQAQACGLPIVCTDAGGLPENVLDGITGKIAERRNAWDIADKIEFLLEQPDLMARMGKNAREHVVEKFNIDKISREFALLYNQLLYG